MSVRYKTSIVRMLMATHTGTTAAVAKLKDMRGGDFQAFVAELRKTWRTWCYNYNAKEFQQWLAENNVDVRLIARRRDHCMHDGLIFRTPSGKECTYWVHFVAVRRREYRRMCLGQWSSMNAHRAALEDAGYVELVL